MNIKVNPSILIFRSAALGDFILSAPALAAIRKHFPHYRVILLTTTSGSKVLRAKASNYIGINPTPWTSLTEPHLVDETHAANDLTSISGMLSARSKLSSYQFKLAIILNDPAAGWSGRIKKLLMLKLVAGLTVPVLGWFKRGFVDGDTKTLSPHGVWRHHVHGPMQFLSELKPPCTYSDDDICFDLRPDSQSVNWASDWLVSHGVNYKRFVAVAPGSIQPHKRWPEGRFKQLIEAILNRYSDVDVVIIGTPSDHDLGQRLKMTSPKRIHNIAGICSILQSAALLARVHLLVGNDGGAMHLGDAMGCKVVSIVPGIEYPDSIEPWHNKALAVRHPVECSPCYNFTFCPQGHNRCMTELPVERILVNCMSVLDREKLP